MTDRLQLQQRVEIQYAGYSSTGTIIEVNDPDQGDFEYYVEHDDGQRSYWPRECLRAFSQN